MALGEIRHGTARGYFGDGCRCGRCKAAQVADRKSKESEGQRRIERRLEEMRAEGCICPLRLHHGLQGRIVPECPVHYPNGLPATLRTA